MAPVNESPLHEDLQSLYHEYRKTNDIDSKAFFFSPECRQICRADPSYAAKNSDTIIRYLHESGSVLDRIYREAGWYNDEPNIPGPIRSFYTMRPLEGNETSDFATMKELAPAGFTSLDEVENKAKDEKWAGLRVNMWTEDGNGNGILVKVQYWWRMESSEDGGSWKQILHDIMYLGPVDGTEKDAGGAFVEDGA
ncbi:hypothetical protein F53441_8467 [Fusarium austroafricanum]|uniref:SnoaL-like domain-containing protein n=1 Tax=Fusarium austroafricanum TaxID=2364996 RepID=A0A8H4KBA7_9HYPO|nr:hypothetical protein F53441_8467 [Fusarium austroafricanum]